MSLAIDVRALNPDLSHNDRGQESALRAGSTAEHPGDPHDKTRLCTNGLKHVLPSTSPVMSLAVEWDASINFASALLLHSCVTVLLKESLNALTIASRLLRRRIWTRRRRAWSTQSENDAHQTATSAVLDAYTSVLSHDRDGTLSELYFTNTGFGLLAVSLASSVAMNLWAADAVLNIVVASTFGAAFLASLASGVRGWVLPVMALRRAGRFIWSDTPFVNFFTLVYIATVLGGESALHLRDYVVFRSIAVLELVFMKSKLAASAPEMQIELVRQLVASEWVAVKAASSLGRIKFTVPARRDDMVPFTTGQRLSVMLLKTGVGFHGGCLQGALGPTALAMPGVGCYGDADGSGYKVYRFAEDVAVIVDCLPESNPTTLWGKFLARAHGVLLRRLGKVRVIYLVRVVDKGEANGVWHANINLVTGVTRKWLDDNFELAPAEEMVKVAGLET